MGQRHGSIATASPSGTRTKLASLLLALFALIGPPLDGPATAQETTTVVGNGDSSKPAPARVETIPMSDIGVKSERAKSQIQESHQALIPNTAVQSASDEIPAMRDRVETQLERSLAARDSSPSVLTLDRLQKEWREIGDTLDGVQSNLRARGKEINEQVAVVREMRAIWSATRKSAIELEVGDELIAQIDTVIKAARDAYEEATKRQAAMIGLQSNVASLSEIVAGELREIAGARNRAVGEVLQKDLAPIWTGEFWMHLDHSKIGEQLSTQETRDTGLIVAYWENNRDRVFIFVLLTALLMAVVSITHRGLGERLADEDDLAPVRAILAHPIALTLLVSFFASLWYFAELARTFEPAFGAATLIPAVVILRKILDRPLLPLLTVAVSIYFVHSFQELIADAAVLSRLIFMAEMLTLAAFATRALRPARLSDIPREMLSNPVLRLVGHGLRAIVVLSSLALIANACGYGALSSLVGGAVVHSIYAAIVVYGTLRVTDGLVAILLRVRPLRLLGMVNRHRFLVHRRVRLIMQIAAWFLWIRASLRRAELWDDAQWAWTHILAAELPFPEISITIGSLLASVAVFWGALLASRFLQFALAEDVYNRVSLTKGRPYAISTLLHYTMLILGFVLAAAAIGFDANRATLLTGAFGVGIGFGLQTIVNNFISGIILLTEQPIQVGDTIAMGEVFGEVQRIGIRSSTVRTWQGAEVIVPNADLISQQVTNWTLSDRRRRMEIPVGIAYGSDPQLVIDTLLEAAERTDQVLSDPAPYVLFKGFGDSSLEFELRAWTDEFDSFLSIRSNICVNVSSCLAEAGLVVPFPQRDLHVRSVPAETPPVASDSEGSTTDRTPLHPVRDEY